MREVLQGLAARAAAENGTAEDVALLLDVVENLAAAVRDADADAALAAVHAFYRAVASASRERLLHERLDQLHEMLGAGDDGRLTDPFGCSAALDVHRAVVAAIVERDGDRADRAMRGCVRAEPVVDRVRTRL